MKNAFGDLIKQKRGEQGISQRDLAAKAKVSAAYISMVENGHESMKFSEEFVVAAAACLAIDVDEAFCAAGRVPDEMRKFITSSPEVMRGVRSAMRQL